MTDAHQVTSNRLGQVLGYSMGGAGRSASEIRDDAWHMPGFQLLTWLMPRHIHVPQVYYLLLALLLGQPVKNVQNNTKPDLDSIWIFVFGVPTSQCATTISGRVSLCPEAAIALLAMVRAMLNQEEKGDAWIISLSDILTSLLGGLTVFSILGIVAYELDEDIENVVRSGAGLAFISYPDDAIAKFNVVPQLFAVLFFS